MTEEEYTHYQPSGIPNDLLLGNDPGVGITIARPGVRRTYDDQVQSGSLPGDMVGPIPPPRAYPDDGPLYATGHSIKSLPLEEAEGLGLLKPGQYQLGSLVNEPQPLPEQARSPGQEYANDIRDAWKSLPYGMRWNIAQSGGLPSFVNAVAQQRQMSEYRLAQIREQKRQHDLQFIEKMMQAGNADALIQYGKKNPDSPALLIGQSIASKDMADVLAGVKEGMASPEELQRLWDGKMTLQDVSAMAEGIKEARKFNAKERAKSNMLSNALKKPEDQRSPFEQQLVRDHLDDRAKVEAEIFGKHAQAYADLARMEKTKMESAQGPQDRDLGIDREAFTLQKYKDKYGPNVRFRQLAPSEQADVNRALSAFQGQITGARTAGAISGEMGSPIKNPSQWRRLNDRGEIESPPPMTSKEELLRSGFVDISQYDSEMKMIESLPTSIQLIDDLKRYAREIIKAGPGLLNRTAQGVELSIAGLRQAGKPTGIMGSDGNPMTLGEVVELYDSVSKGNAEAIARSGGGLSGAATEGDVIRTLQNLAKTSDSVNVMEEKFRRFRKLFQDKYDLNVKVVFGKGKSKASDVDSRLDRLEQLLRNATGQK